MRIPDYPGPIGTLDGTELIAAWKGGQISLPAQRLMDLMVAENPSFKGAKGDTGGNVMSVGPFDGLGSVTIGAGADLIATSEYHSGSGRGGGFYQRWKVPMTALPAIAAGANTWWRPSADGAKWFPVLSGATWLTYRQLGAYGDYVYATKTVNHDDYAAFLAYRQICEWGRIDNDNFSLYAACPKLLIEDGNYYHSARLDFDFGTVLVQAPYLGPQNGGNPVVFTSAAGVGGYKIYYAGQSTRSGAVGAMGSILRGIKWRSHGVGSDTTVPGGLIQAGQCWSDHCSYEDFPGHGLEVFGDTGASPATNANLCRVSGGNFRNNGYNGVGSGLKLHGNDGNQITVDGIPNFFGNAQWAIDEQSFLGNLIISAHADSNGVVGAGTRNAPQTIGACCNYGGFRWATVAGLEGTASTEVPGTGPSWIQLYAGGAHPFFPTWTSGMTFIQGGAYHSNNGAGFATFLHCYSEGTQGPSQFAATTLIVGGLPGAGQVGGGYLGSANNSLITSKLRTNGATTTPGESVTVYVGGIAGANGTFLNIGRSSDGSTPWAWEIGADGALHFRYGGLDGSSPIDIYPIGGNHPSASGFSHGLYIGSIFIDSAAAAPSTGAWELGSYRFNNLSSSTKERGWRVIAAGTFGGSAPTIETEYRRIYGSTTVDLASIASGAISAAISITVTGAAVGDIVTGISTTDGSIPLGAFVRGQVTAANTVTAFIKNDSGGAYDPPNATYRAEVVKQ